MGRRRHGVPEGLEPEQAAHVRRALDKLEERLMMAPPGLHRAGDPATEDACVAAGLTPAAAMVWACFDGIEVGAESARLLMVSEISSATAEAEAEGLIRPGDLVIGDSGRDLLVLPADPYEEGADVVLVEDDGERLPEASSVAHLVLGWVAEAGVLFGDDGEFRDELFGEDGEPTAAARRKLLRRRLDVDPDAPRPRLRLAQDLRATGELRGAAAELKQVLRRAPELPWAHEALGRVREDEGDRDGARRAYGKAAEFMDPVDPELGAYFWAKAARWSDGDARIEAARRVMTARPEFGREQVAAARALIEREAWAEANEAVALGLAVAPGQVELLALRGELEAARGGGGGGVDADATDADGDGDADGPGNVPHGA